MSELSAYLAAQKKLFLVDAKEGGGKAPGFRSFIGAQFSDDPKFFSKLVLDALMEAATRTWQQPPRKRGPDLFSIAGYTIPEYLTRPAHGYASAEDLEDEDETAFEKVDQQFATVQDLYDDATIKLRKAAQSAAAAEQQMKAADDARRRARGNMATFLREITDATILAPA